MTVALQSPSDVSAIVSVDNAPVSVPLSSDFAKYVRGMKEIEEAKVTKQKDADMILAQYEEVHTYIHHPSKLRHSVLYKLTKSHSPFQSANSCSQTLSGPKKTTSSSSVCHWGSLVTA